MENYTKQLTTDSAELLVALEILTEELRGHNNDDRGQKMITESLKIQQGFREKYGVQPSTETLAVIKRLNAL